MKRRFIQAAILAWVFLHVGLWVWSGNVRNLLDFSRDCWPFFTATNGDPSWSPGFHVAFLTEFYDLRPFFLYVPMGALAATLTGESGIAKGIAGFLGGILAVLLVIGSRH